MAPGGILVARAGRRPAPALVLRPREAILRPRLPRRLPDDFPGVVARLPRGVVPPAAVLPVPGAGPGGDRRLDHPHGIPDLHAQAEPPGVESHARLALPQPFRRDRGRQGRLPGRQGTARDARDRRGDRDGLGRTPAGRAVRQGRAGHPGECPDGLGPGAGRRAPCAGP